MRTIEARPPWMSHLQQLAAHCGQPLPVLWDVCSGIGADGAYSETRVTALRSEIRAMCLSITAPAGAGLFSNCQVGDRSHSVSGCRHSISSSPDLQSPLSNDQLQSIENQSIENQAKMERRFFCHRLGVEKIVHSFDTRALLAKVGAFKDWMLVTSVATQTAMTNSMADCAAAAVKGENKQASAVPCIVLLCPVLLCLVLLCPTLSAVRCIECCAVY